MKRRNLSCFEDSLTRHSLSLNNEKDGVGLFTEERLLVKDEWLFSIHTNENDVYL